MIFPPPFRTSISLVFFAAYLFELDTIKSDGTIRNYMSHVSQFYVKKGYPKNRLNSPLIKAVMRGVKRCMPPKSDSRIAFLLIQYHIPRWLRDARSCTTKKSFAAILLGLFAMLRFHTYNKLCRENLTIVLKGGGRSFPIKF